MSNTPLAGEDGDYQAVPTELISRHDISPYTPPKEEFTQRSSHDEVLSTTIQAMNVTNSNNASGGSVLF